MSIRACLTVTATVALLGCGLRVGTIPLSGPYPPRPAAAEVLVWTVDIPECPFEELGLTTARAGLGVRSVEVLVAGMKQEARRLGGDALVGLRAAPRREGGAWGYSATVVRFSNEECRS